MGQHRRVGHIPPAELDHREVQDGHCASPLGEMLQPRRGRVVCGPGGPIAQWAEADPGPDLANRCKKIPEPPHINRIKGGDRQDKIQELIITLVVSVMNA